MTLEKGLKVAVGDFVVSVKNTLLGINDVPVQKSRSSISH